MILEPATPKKIKDAWPDKQKVLALLEKELADHFTFPTSTCGTACYSRRLQEESRGKVVAALNRATTSEELIELLRKEVRL